MIEPSDVSTRFKNAVIAALVIISLGCAAGIWQGFDAGKNAQSALTQFKKDSKVRRDQSCTVSERNYQRNVDGVKLTYKYLSSLPTDEARTSLNQLIIKQLPETIQDAEFSKPAPYCLEKGIGLPGDKFPALPPEQDFSNLLVQK